jgi:glutamate---cysteine ligase / carboxylate-amine ligase
MSTKKEPLHLFEGYGVELEYMIVHIDTLDVYPITDKVIYDEVGAYISDVEFGDIAWSNELALHVIELKTQGPVNDLANLQWKMLEHVRKINKLLEKHNAILMPTGAHPLMNPDTDTKLWPYGSNEIYSAYNRIFNCSGHGWSNLQSTHLNLPFANDEEFGKLHAAIRVLLPIIPAISASSPILDGKVSGFDDTRIEVYRHNQEIIPIITGKIIPESAFTKQEYNDVILTPMYTAIAPYDKEGILQEEFLNSRGAIARFQRNTIEIRLIDIQESPVADLAVLQAIVSVLKALVAERWLEIEALKKWDEDKLNRILTKVVKDGQQAVLTDFDYIKLFGFDCKENCTVGELWKYLVKETVVLDDQPEVEYALRVILSRGNLSRRILEAVGTQPTKEKIKEVYQQLTVCLQNGGVFLSDKLC